jgi:DNA-binding NarL/FixJ family response regulator
MPNGTVLPMRSPASLAYGSGDGRVLVTARPGLPAINSANGSRHLTDDQREVLKLLSMGATDAAIARKLAISLRTARRRVAELKHKLDVSSRVQVALAASQRGWLEEE